jgi:hypothetical protein
VTFDVQELALCWLDEENSNGGGDRVEKIQKNRARGGFSPNGGRPK